MSRSHLLLLQHCAKNEVFHSGFCLYMRPNLQETADLITFTEDILNGKFNILYSVVYSCGTENPE